MINLNKNNFETEIKNGLVLVDFWAAWCGPCRAQAPYLEQLDASKVKVCKVNVDENLELAEKFNIMSIPTLIVFKDGKQVKMSTGVHNLEQLKKLTGV
jgi:thioredoxin 1